MKKNKTSDAITILKNRYVKNDVERQASIDAEQTNAEIAQIIYDLREKAGLTQAKLADLIGTTQSVISRLEDADYEGHSLSMLQRVAKALGFKMKISLINDVPYNGEEITHSSKQDNAKLIEDIHLLEQNITKTINDACRKIMDLQIKHTTIVMINNNGTEEITMHNATEPSIGNVPAQYKIVKRLAS